MIESLILVRLLTPSKKAITTTRLKNDLAPLAQHRYEGSAWTNRVDTGLRDLEQQGYLTQSKPNRAIKLELTSAGRQKALKFLGVEAMPDNLTWTKLKTEYLTVRALNLEQNSVEARARVGQASGLRGSILKQHYDLPGSALPTESQALDALLWRQLGIETTKRFTLGEVKKMLLNQALGSKTPVDLKRAKLLLPAKAAGARRTDSNDLRLSVLRSLVDGETDAKTTPAGLRQFGRQVQETARHCSSGWFGPRKVFISHVWQDFQAKNADYQLDEATFKSWLVQANREGCLSLSRADLVEAMNPQDVADSETTYLNASFHFIHLPENAS